MNTIKTIINQYLGWIVLPKLGITDVLEIMILAFLVYHIIIWVRDTRAWRLFKGISVLIVIWLVAALLQFNVILWLFAKTINVGIIALMIMFQPELRRALEKLGSKKILASFFYFEDNGEKEGKMTTNTINQLVAASVELGKNNTGALIVIEKDVLLTEYERTGIEIDSAISSQLLINIFEHNTPLHDGAVIIRGNRIVAATCYLPLSDNMHLSKDLGTRHRAGVGISEVTDSLTIIVSEETGRISVARDGKLIRNLSGDKLRMELQNIHSSNKDAKSIKMRKGWRKNEKNSDKQSET